MNTDINFTPPRMETIAATAKLFGLPEYFVRSKAVSGEIVAAKAGRKYLINVKRFEEYLNTNTVNTHSETPVTGIRPINIR